MPSLITILGLLAMALTGCSRDPSLEVSGSFFPAWMISSLVGIGSTVVLVRVFGLLGLAPFLKPHLLVYGALVLSLTLAVWLLFYS